MRSLLQWSRTVLCVPAALFGTQRTVPVFRGTQRTVPVFRRVPVPVFRALLLYCFAIDKGRGSVHNMGHGSNVTQWDENVPIKNLEE